MKTQEVEWKIGGFLYFEVIIAQIDVELWVSWNYYIETKILQNKKLS